MATILLATSVIFDHLNGRFGRTEYLDDLLKQGHMHACCPVNFTEVYSGLRSGEEERTKNFLHSLEFYPVTQEIATHAGLLRRDWRQKGQTLSHTDVTIAAVAAPREMNVPDIAFRPITSEDTDFLYTVYAQTRTEELAPVPWTEAQKEAFLRSQFDAHTGTTRPTTGTQIFS